MQESRNAIENGLKSKDKEVADDLAALTKKAKVSHRTISARNARLTIRLQYLENEMQVCEG